MTYPSARALAVASASLAGLGLALSCTACVLSEQGTDLRGGRPESLASAGGTGAVATGAGAAPAGGGAGGSGSSITAASAGGANVGACGDGVVDDEEACDDGGAAAADGCSPLCAIEPGWACVGAPSQCTVLQPQMVTRSGLALAIEDDGYDGSLASMRCVDLAVLGDDVLRVFEVHVTLAVDHPFVGDLVAKLVSPTGTVTTLFSRPGHAESSDDGADLAGRTDASDLRGDYPVAFFDTAETDAELLGADVAGFGGGVICREGAQICSYRPNPGAGPGEAGLADFEGQAPGGEWRLCVGDASDRDAGVLRAVTIAITSR